MAEAKAKRKLQELSQKWNQKISVDQVFAVYKNSEKYTFERQVNLLKQMMKPYCSDFDKHCQQFEVDVRKNKKTSHEAFIVFLNNATIGMPSVKPQIPLKPIVDSKMSLKSSIESPVLCSTRVESTLKSEVVVSEVSLSGGDIQNLIHRFVLD